MFGVLVNKRKNKKSVEEQLMIKRDCSNTFVAEMADSIINDDSGLKERGISRLRWRRACEENIFSCNTSGRIGEGIRWKRWQQRRCSSSCPCCQKRAQTLPQHFSLSSARLPVSQVQRAPYEWVGVQLSFLNSSSNGWAGSGGVDSDSDPFSITVGTEPGHVGIKI